jgi:hypothetical protein
MTDATTTATPVDAAAAAAAAPTAQQPAGTSAPAATAAPEEIDYKAEAEKWKALSRKNEDKATANAEKAKQFDALEEANKTELQKAQDALTIAQQEAALAKVDAIRSRISAATGVPENLLAGATEDTIQAAADAALAFKGTTATTAARVGGADISGGAAKPTIYTREQIKNPEFYKAHRDDILAAQSQGRITS